MSCPTGVCYLEQCLATRVFEFCLCFWSVAWRGADPCFSEGPLFPVVVRIARQVVGQLCREAAARVGAQATVGPGASQPHGPPVSLSGGRAPGEGGWGGGWGSFGPDNDLC